MLRLPAASRLEREYDVVVVGGGPAGLTAAIYASKFKLKTVVVAERVGGLLTETLRVDGYPGLPEVEAARLAGMLAGHVARCGVPVVVDRVERFWRDGSAYAVETARGRRTRAKAVIVAVGVKRKRLGVPGEERLKGKGVSYCALCDAPLYRGASAVAVVGGGDSAAEAALLLSSYAEKVYLVHRRRELRAKPDYVQALEANPKVELLPGYEVEEILGTERVEGLALRGVETGEKRVLEVRAVFIEVGYEPPSEWARRNGLEVDEDGFIKVDEWMRTNLPGVFAAGDCTTMWKGFRQVVLAAAMGAVAARSAYEYLKPRGA